MTTINESQTAKGYTPAASVPSVFGRPRTIESITIHHWGALGQRHDDVVNFFVSGPGTTSAHFVVSAGRIDCIVSPEDAAWHTGTALGNATSIGIECHPEATPEDYQTVAELVKFLRDSHGNLPLIPHRNWSSTACPGVWDLNKIDQLAAGSAAINPSQETEVTPAQMQEIKQFIQACVNDSINKMWAAEGVTQQLIQGVANGINNIKTGSVDTAALAKAVNDDAAKRMQQ